LGADDAGEVGRIEVVVRPERRRMAAVVDEGGDRLVVDVVEPCDRDPLIDRTAVRPAIGGDPIDGSDTDRRRRVAAPGPGLGDSVGDRGTDLHRATAFSTTELPVRLASYAAVTISTAFRPSAPVTAGGRPVRTASRKSVYWRTWPVAVVPHVAAAGVAPFDDAPSPPA